jgi:small subunit ribosomal protein S6
MRTYEIAFIVHPDLEETAFNEVLEKVKGWITESGGKVTNVDLWGKRKLAYEIRNQSEGQYVFVLIEMEPSSLAGLENNLRLQESIMRFMISSAAPTTT